MGKYLLRGGLAGIALVAVVVLALELPDQIREARVARSQKAKAKSDAAQTAGPTGNGSTSMPGSVEAGLESIPALPANATSVPDDNILTLARFVDLPNSAEHHPDKKRWSQAITAAEKLAQGPCDCAQRNWLTHFIEMGNFALSDSESDYRESAKLMATLGRNDEHAMALSKRSN